MSEDQLLFTTGNCGNVYIYVNGCKEAGIGIGVG
jgi:hypothetical protein